MFGAVLTTALVGSLWNRFFDVIFRIDNLQVRRWIVYMIPTAAALILLLINIPTGILYYITEDNHYVRGEYYWISATLQYISFFLVIVRALVYDLGVKTLRRRRMRNGILWLGILTLVFGTMQILSDGKLALHCLGMTTGVFIMFIRFQDEQITNDSLTTLHNRYALDGYLTDKIKGYATGSRRNHKLYFIMMDVDKLKMINDRFGHNEGDEVLRAIAFQLKKVGIKYNTDLFLSRYAGDEFAAVFETTDPTKVEELKKDIKEYVAELSRGREHPISISVGYAEYAGKAMSLETLFELADKWCYIDKQVTKIYVNPETDG
jgi:diguanylate cyclase (GGDEF)-like protein